MAELGQVAGSVVLEYPYGLVGARDDNYVASVRCSDQTLNERSFLGRVGGLLGGLPLFLQPPAPLVGLEFGIGAIAVCGPRLLVGLLNSPSLGWWSFWRGRIWRRGLLGGRRWVNNLLFRPHGVFPCGNLLEVGVERVNITPAGGKDKAAADREEMIWP